MNNLKYIKIKVHTLKKIDDIEEFTKELLTPMYDFISHTNFIGIEIREKYPILKDFKYSKGCPDLIAILNKKILFIEIKSENDSLRTTQLEWIQKNQQFEVIILHVVESYDIQPNIEYLKSAVVILEDSIKHVELALQEEKNKNNHLSKEYNKIREMLSVANGRINNMEKEFRERLQRIYGDVTGYDMIFSTKSFSTLAQEATEKEKILSNNYMENVYDTPN